MKKMRLLFFGLLCVVANAFGSTMAPARGAIKTFKQLCTGELKGSNFTPSAVELLKPYINEIFGSPSASDSPGEKAVLERFLETVFKLHCEECRKPALGLKNMEAVTMLELSLYNQPPYSFSQNSSLILPLFASLLDEHPEYAKNLEIFFEQTGGKVHLDVIYAVYFFANSKGIANPFGVSNNKDLSELLKRVTEYREHNEATIFTAPGIWNWGATMLESMAGEGGAGTSAHPGS